MRTVGIRELKNRLSEYLRAVREGETVQVTDRGKVVAEIVPPGTARHPDIPEGLLALERRGLARIGWPNDPALYPEMPRIAPDGTARRWIDEDRGEG